MCSYFSVGYLWSKFFLLVGWLKGLMYLRIPTTTKQSLLSCFKRLPWYFHRGEMTLMVDFFQLIQRSYQRWLDKRIYKTEMRFWAVLGSRGCREKKFPKCHKYATFWGGFFNFLWARKHFQISLKIF